MNAVEIAEAVSELAAAPFDRNEFPFAFLTAFSNKETTVKRLHSSSSNSSDVAGRVLQRNILHRPGDQRGNPNPLPLGRNRMKNSEAETFTRSRAIDQTRETGISQKLGLRTNRPNG